MIHACKLFVRGIVKFDMKVLMLVHKIYELKTNAEIDRVSNKFSRERYYLLVGGSDYEYLQQSKINRMLSPLCISKGVSEFTGYWINYIVTEWQMTTYADRILKLIESRSVQWSYGIYNNSLFIFYLLSCFKFLMDLTK